MGVISPFFRYRRIMRRGDSNKYYLFRNLDRLRALKRFNFLFGFLKVLSMLTLTVAVCSFLFWIFFVVVFTLGAAAKNPDAIINFFLISVSVAAAVLLISHVLKFIIEALYIKAEKRELKEFPENSEKFLKILNAAVKIRRVNLVMLVLSVAVVGAAVLLKQETLYFVAAVLVFVSYAALSIMRQTEYHKVAAEIEQVRAERKENKKLMIE